MYLSTEDQNNACDKKKIKTDDLHLGFDLHMISWQRIDYML